MIKFAADDFLLLTELFSGCDFCEVKGEGYILIFILYSFFRVFPFFDPRVVFPVFPPFLHAYIYKGVFKPSPFSFLAILLMIRELRVKGGEGTFLFCIKHFFAFECCG